MKMNWELINQLSPFFTFEMAATTFLGRVELMIVASNLDEAVRNLKIIVGAANECEVDVSGWDE